VETQIVSTLKKKYTTLNTDNQRFKAMKKSTTFSFLPVHFRYIFSLLGKQWIARSIAVTLLVFVTAFIFALISPTAGEPFFYNLANLSGLLTFTFAAITSLIVCAFGLLLISWCLSLAVRMAYQDIGETMKRNRDNDPAALDAWNIYPDIAVFRNLDEKDGDFEKRISDARAKKSDDVWVVVVEFQKVAIRVDDNTPKGMYNTRSGEGSFFPELTDKEVSEETEQEYKTRLSDFCREWRPFSQREKLSRIKGSVFAKALQSSANVLIFCLLSLSAFGQNTDKIHTSLQDNDRIVAANNVVNYTFTAGQSATRTADGTKTISQLYAAGRAGADSRNVGEVDGISINGVAVPLVKKVIPSIGSEGKPAALYADASSALPLKSRNFSESIPDSAAVVNGLNDVRNQLPFYKSKFYQFFSPIIEFCSYLFLFLSPLFAITLGFFNLVSRSARQNGNLGHTVQKQQIQFAAFAWWTAIFLIGSIYLGFTFTMFFWELHPALITALCFGAFYPAKWAINRLTPNGEYQGTMTVTRNSGNGRNQLGM
jgi:hypothetical protein